MKRENLLFTDIFYDFVAIWERFEFLKGKNCFKMFII